MPLLPIPLDTPIDGDLIVTSETDVLAELPETHQVPETAPVRDALVAGFAEGFIEYQGIASRAAGQSDPLRATGEYLRAYAEEHEVVPEAGESDVSIRTRMFEWPSIVTPNAIEAAINRIIAPKHCYIHELDLDGWFVQADPTNPAWGSYVGSSPDYPDRYYAELPYTLPGGCIPSNDIPRSFHVRIPSMHAQDDMFQWIGDAFFVGDNLNVFSNQQTAADIYNAVVAQVEMNKGQGVAWSLLVDTGL